MRYIFFCTFFLFVSTLNAQKTPTLLIDGTPVKFQGDLSLPYWVSAGKTIAFSVDAISASILEFNINSNELQFNQVMHLTTSGTVPTGKAWKIEAIGLGPNTADIPTSGFSTAATPEIFTSPEHSLPLELILGLLLLVLQIFVLRPGEAEVKEEMLILLLTAAVVVVEEHMVMIVSQLSRGRVTRLQLEVQGKQVRWEH